jgi:cell division protein FtsB
MKKLIAQRYTVRHNLAAIICSILAIYFAGNALTGDRSLFRLMNLNKEISAVGDDVITLHERRVALEDKVVRLRPGSIDPDLLEERARVMLGFQHPDERTLIQ